MKNVSAKARLRRADTYHHGSSALAIAEHWTRAPQARLSNPPTGVRSTSVG
jgi:hypothetical protein